MIFGYFNKSISMFSMSTASSPFKLLAILISFYLFINWKIRWIIIWWNETQTEFFPLEDELDFSKGTLFSPLEDKLIYSLPWETNWIFLLGDKLNFSLGRQTEFFKGYIFEFFPLEEKLSFSQGTYYLWMFFLQRQSEFFKGYLYYINPEYFLSLKSKSNLLKSVNYWPRLIPELY